MKGRTLQQYKVLQNILFEKKDDTVPLLLIGDSESQDSNSNSNDAVRASGQLIELANEYINDENGDINNNKNDHDNNDANNNDSNNIKDNNDNNNDNNNNDNNNDNNNNDNNNNNNNNNNNKEEKEDKDVFLYIIYSGCEHYYKVGFNSMSLNAFLSRYHTYYGEFKFLKFPLNGIDLKAARRIGKNIEKKFKNKHVEDTAFFKHELFDRKRDGVEMLGVYKKSMQTIMNKVLSKKVS